MTPTEKLDGEITRLANENGILTASDYARYLNGNDNGPSALVEDAEHWESFSIKTARDLAMYLDMCHFSDCYKESRGIRPSGFDYNRAMQWMEMHFPEE